MQTTAQKKALLECNNNRKKNKKKRTQQKTNKVVNILYAYRSPCLSWAVQFEHVKHFKWNTWCWIGFGWFGDCWLLDCDVVRMTNSFGDIVWLHAEHGGGANILQSYKWMKKKPFLISTNWWKCSKCFYYFQISSNQMKKKKFLHQGINHTFLIELMYQFTCFSRSVNTTWMSPQGWRDKKCMDKIY